MLDMGLDYLSLGMSHPVGSPERTNYLNAAVDYVHEAGYPDYTAKSLLARGSESDLQAAARIASRSGMRLVLADVHLAFARQSFSRAVHQESVRHYNNARALISETGYHRRDSELEQIRVSLSQERRSVSEAQ